VVYKRIFLLISDSSFSLFDKLLLVYDFEELGPPIERLEQQLGLLDQPDDVQRCAERLDARQLHRLAIVDRVGGDEKGQQAVVTAAQLPKRHVGEARPGAINDRGARRLDNVQVGRRHGELGHGRQDNAAERLAYAHRRQVTAARKLGARAPLRVALPEIPHVEWDRESARFPSSPFERLFARVEPTRFGAPLAAAGFFGHPRTKRISLIIVLTRHWVKKEDGFEF